MDLSEPTDVGQLIIILGFRHSRWSSLTNMSCRNYVGNERLSFTGFVQFFCRFSASSWPGVLLLVSQYENKI